MELKPWLKSKDRTLEWLGEKLGMSVTSTWRLVNGVQEPGLTVAAEIEALTDGAVTASDMLTTLKAAQTEAA